MTEQERLEKNKRISESKRSTIERHSNMLVKTFNVKIQWNQCSKTQKEALEKVFLEQKWLKNYILNWSRISENKINKFDIKQKTITKKNAKMENKEVTLKYLSSQAKMALVSQMYSNIKTLHTLKSKGKKVGHLKYSKEETAISLVQPGISYQIKSSKRVKIQGLGKAFPVNGMKQLINIPGLEYANARLLKRSTGYYIQFVTYQPKTQSKEKIKETIGIDFGCSTAFTLSNGEKISANVPESERLKKLQKQQAKKVKGSKNFQRAVKKVRKEYQKITNRKNDLANKLVAKFSKYETVVIQDEQLHNWHKSGHGKAVQHSVLGRVKAKLLQNPNTVVLGKTVPTTKLCTKCGQCHDEIKVWNRVFKCDCGVELDRDIHAAQNMVWFYKNNVGVERTKVKRVEMESIVSRALALESSEKSQDSFTKAKHTSKKHEAVETLVSQ